MQIEVLGSLRVITRNGTVKISAAQQRIVLATLAVNPGNEVAAATLARAVWGDAPPKSLNVTLRGLVSKLRRALGEDRDLIVTDLAGHGEQDSAYRLEAGRDDVDMFGLEALYKSGQSLIRASDWEQAYGVLTKAESFWRGPPFMDVPSDFLRGEYVRYLEELRAQMREARLEAHVRLSLRTAADAVPELWRLAGAYPERENPRKLLMLALYRAGRHREALEVFRQWWGYLRDEIGAEPGPAIRSVSERITRQDEALLAESLGSDVLP